MDFARSNVVLFENSTPWRLRLEAVGGGSLDLNGISYISITGFGGSTDLFNLVHVGDVASGIP
jgi:hypothetical protein